MTYATVERLILVKLARAVVWHGVADRTDPDHAAVLRKLELAIDEELANLPRAKRESALRHAERNTEIIMAPHIAQRVHCAAVGLALVYVIQELTNQGLYEPAGAFADALENGLMSEDGTISERHNIELASAASVKLGRKIITALNSLGYFAAAEMAA